MLEFGNVINTLYSASVFTHIYGSDADSDSHTLEDSDARGVLQYLLSPSATTYSSSSSGRGASEAISLAQRAVNDAEAFHAEVQAIAVLAQGLQDMGLTETQRTALIEQIEQAVQAFNAGIADTELNGDLFFGPGGKDIEISIGNASAIVLEAQDHSMSMDGADLTTDEGIAAFIENAVSAGAGLEDHQAALHAQLGRLGHATQIIEYGECGDVDEDRALRIAAAAASHAVSSMDTLYGIDSDRIASLLTGPGLRRFNNPPRRILWPGRDWM